MALKKMILNNFRGKENEEIPFEKKVFLKGPNGAGKSTIKEAIVFLFTGSDSYGSKNPQHLISDGKQDTKVTVFTDKAEISRTLTRKGNGTIKVTRDGVPTTYSQTQLEEVVGSAELFLSAFVPGYFLSLPFEKQNKVLAEVTPGIDKHALLKEHFGVEIKPEDKMRYNLNRRYDLVASQVAQDRREIEKEISRLSGEAQGLLNMKPLDKPVEPAEINQIASMEALRKRWTDYERAFEIYNRDFPKVARIKDENKIRATRREQIKVELASLKILEVPPVHDCSVIPGFVALRDSIKPMPQEPANFKVPDADNCPSCGQAVKLSHREQMKKKNEQAKADYVAELEAVKAFNADVANKMKVYQDEVVDASYKAGLVKMENEKTKAKKHTLELELARLADQEIPDVGVPPEAPEELFDELTYQKAKEAVDEYRKKLNEYEFVERQIKKNADKIQEIEKVTANYKVRFDELKTLETALSGMTQLEMNLKTKLFEMSDVRFEVKDSIEVFYKGIPYILCSTGQRMKSDLEICFKLNSLMPRPLNAVFVDNADLVDVINVPETIQVFIAEVEPKLEQLEVSYG